LRINTGRKKPAFQLIKAKLMNAEELLKKILDKCQIHNPDCDLKLIRRAYDFAAQIHTGQKRISGEEYIFHCLSTAEIVADLKVDSKTVAASLLHDVLDDSGEKQPELEKKLEKEFGKEITNLVRAVTKIDKIKYQGAERAVENLRKMFLATAEDIRVVVIKLADRLHNMRTLQALPKEKQHRIALETLEIFAPLADRLGIGKIRGELEDFSFRYLMPDEYHWLVSQVRDQYEEWEKYLEKLIPYLKKELVKEGIAPTEMHWRAKNYYSLYQKLKRYEMNLNRIYDLVALRIILPTVEDCYATLGVIHKLWRPLPGRIKDYIALPKPNGYQSLHTTVFSQNGKITEIQIRTEKMHEEAERGIAAHWYYTEQKGLRAYIKKIFAPAPAKEIKWIQQLQEWQKDARTSPQEFFQPLKIDFFKDRIFVFTPKGDVIDLPEGATSIDFAYHIHSEVGNHCQGAKVDGKLVALDKPLENGQVIEIAINKNAKPSQDWLKIAKTSQAHTKIKQWFNKYKTPLAPDEKETPEPETPKPAKPPKIITPKAVVAVAGDPKITTALAKCCKPQPPDAIVGYITLNQRITVHRRNCHNLAKIHEKSRLIEVSWKNE
jgi:GTP pyrophosphokinase